MFFSTNFSLLIVVILQHFILMSPLFKQGSLTEVKMFFSRVSWPDRQKHTKSELNKNVIIKE